MLLFGVLVGALTACQSGMTDAPGVTVTGYVVVPPAAGVAEIQGLTGDGLLFTLANAAVEASGRFTALLPAVPARLPARTYAGVLPYLPSSGLLDFRQFSCANQPVASEPGARFVVVRLGSYRVAGRVTGQLLPAATSVGGDPSQPRRVTSETYAFADRDVRVSGDLPCSLTRPDGVVVPSSVQVGYDLKRGWNRLTVNTLLSVSGELSVETQASTDLSGVQWAYLPSRP